MRRIRLFVSCSSSVGISNTSRGTVVRIADQLGNGTELLRRWVALAEVDAGDVSVWECRLALQDALRTRFIEN